MVLTLSINNKPCFNANEIVQKQKCHDRLCKSVFWKVFLRAIVHYNKICTNFWVFAFLHNFLLLTVVVKKIYNQVKYCKKCENTKTQKYIQKKHVVCNRPKSCKNSFCNFKDSILPCRGWWLFYWATSQHFAILSIPQSKFCFGSQ